MAIDDNFKEPIQFSRPVTHPSCGRRLAHGIGSSIALLDFQFIWRYLTRQRTVF
jgi:hypothetical protein